MHATTTTAEWLSSIGGVAAALIAAGALVFGVYTYWRQGEDRKREQADHISAWVVPSDLPGRSSLRILNTSGRGIHHCQILVTEDGDPVLLLNRGGFTGEIAAGTLRVVPPGEPIPLFSGKLGVKPEDAEVELVFRDQAERHWRRTVDGRLESLTREEADAAWKRLDAPTDPTEEA